MGVSFFYCQCFREYVYGITFAFINVKETTFCDGL